MEEIINSIMQSPENTNPNVLRGQLLKMNDSGSGGSSDNSMMVYTVSDDSPMIDTVPSIGQPTFDSNNVCTSVAILNISGSFVDYMTGTDIEVTQTMYMKPGESNGSISFIAVPDTPEFISSTAYANFSSLESQLVLSEWNPRIGDMVTQQGETKWTITIIEANT